MQKLLIALKEFSMDEIKAIRKLDGYSFRVHGKNDPEVYRMVGIPKGFRVRYFDSTESF